MDRSLPGHYHGWFITGVLGLPADRPDSDLRTKLRNTGELYHT